MTKLKNRFLSLFKGVEASERSHLLFASFSLAIWLLFCLLVPSCGPTHQLPPREEVVTTYKDSTILHILDSLRITEETRYKDYAGLLDTLSINGARSHMRAWTDTTHNILAGELKEDKVEERYKIIYKDRIVKKDSLVFKEIPVEVEKVKEVVPRWAWWSLAFNILGIILGGLLIYLKLKL